MFILPECKKPYTAYEPYIDEKTMNVHHLGHHMSYVEKLNRAIVEGGYNYDRIEDIFENIQDFNDAVRNNAGGHYNHTLYWTLLNDTMTTPSMELMNLINTKYGMVDDFKAEFTKAALEFFGAGWVWLVINENNELDIITTKNHDNPLMSDINKGYPLIVLDLWEHGYYLKHQNRKIDFIKDFWSVLDWDEVSMRLSQRPEMNNLA
jgi:Fe-Mn family superoxide dismutase